MRTSQIGRRGLRFLAPGGTTADAATLPNLCTYLGQAGGDNGDGGDGSGGGQGGGQVGGQVGGSGNSGPIGESGSIDRTGLTGPTRRSSLPNCWRGGSRSLLRRSSPGW